jgi:hypothetical protein
MRSGVLGRVVAENIVEFDLGVAISCELHKAGRRRSQVAKCKT